jgi:hypothetical protein
MAELSFISAAAESQKNKNPLIFPRQSNKLNALRKKRVFKNKIMIRNFFIAALLRFVFFQGLSSA